MIKYTHVSHLKSGNSNKSLTEKKPIVVNVEEIKPVIKTEKKKKKSIPVAPIVVEEAPVETTQEEEKIDLSEWLKDDIED